MIAGTGPAARLRPLILCRSQMECVALRTIYRGDNSRGHRCPAGPYCAEGFDSCRTSFAGRAGQPPLTSSICADVAEVWRRGSVVSSMAARSDRDRSPPRIPDLREIPPGTSGSGRAAGRIRRRSKQAVAGRVLSAALYTASARSGQDHTSREDPVADAQAVRGSPEPPKG